MRLDSYAISLHNAGSYQPVRDVRAEAAELTLDLETKRSLKIVWTVLHNKAEVVTNRSAAIGKW
jgi:hypothetical protein